MLSQEEKIYVEQACLKLKERGWFPGEKFDLSTITEQEIAGFEQQHQVTLPSLYRTFLTSSHSLKKVFIYVPLSTTWEILAPYG